jgi:hypothetical protein
MVHALKEAQGNVATGKGAKYAKQIVMPEVNFVDKKDSLAPFYKLTHPEKDHKLKRPGYTNNVSVLIDLKGQEFQFKAPLAAQPNPIDLDIAHSVLDRMREGAMAGGQFVPERGSTVKDEIAFLMREQAKERALKELHDKEVLMLREGFSPEEIAGLTGATRERILRKYEMASPIEALVSEQVIRGVPGLYEDMGTASVSSGVGVSTITDGPRTTPALSVPFMFHRAGPQAGRADAMGRTRATGAPSAGFMTNRAPATGSRISSQYTSEGQSLRGSPMYGQYSVGATTPSLGPITPVGAREAAAAVVAQATRGRPRGATPAVDLERFRRIRVPIDPAARASALAVPPRAFAEGGGGRPAFRKLALE